MARLTFYRSSGIPRTLAGKARNVLSCDFASVWYGDVGKREKQCPFRGNLYAPLRDLDFSTDNEQLTCV